MLFNSLIFVALFLPVTLLLLDLAARRGGGLAVAWLGLASLAFYAWTEWRYLPLLLGSVVFNHAIGMRISRTAGSRGAKSMLIVGVGMNLALLGWFKYSGLLARTAEVLLDTPLAFMGPVLPIGISFFTFTQIAFLVDASRGLVSDRGFWRYLLFVTYFPHLIAGPILHHAVMIPQFARRTFGRIDAASLRAGMAIFLVGLLKKVVLADQAAQFVGPVFDASADPRLGAADAWAGVLAYTCQIYFDFSGYTDMAIGLSRMMKVTLPENFCSPYKAGSMIEFWRRWHISLSTFLRDYLYFVLGGNRRGVARRYTNLMATMLLGGLWHGASWTFLAWGGLHGAYLVTNHAWRSAIRRCHVEHLTFTRPYRLAAWVLTMLCVVVAWVFFRASDFDTGFRLIKLMFGLSMAAEAGRAVNFSIDSAYLTIALCAVLALLAPNTAELRKHWRQRRSGGKGAWSVGTAGLWASMGALTAAIAVLTLVAESAASRSAFIYFSF